MLWSRQQVQDNLRNREGKTVFYLPKGDILTNDARDYLTRQRISVLPAREAKGKGYRLENGEILSEKPEHYTHLNGELLVPKTHPIIAFRGSVDLLEAELLLCMQAVPRQKKALGEILNLARRLIRCDVLQESVGETVLDGLTEEQQRKMSHFPQEYFGIPHFMPQPEDSGEILMLNRVRCVARQAELRAVAAFTEESRKATRPDIIQALNRISSMLYILMLREKAARSGSYQYPKTD